MATPAGPQRRERRRTHLDASAVPVERALLARAAALEDDAAAPLDDDGFGPGDLALEFRLLAEELHYW